LYSAKSFSWFDATGTLNRVIRLIFLVDDILTLVSLGVNCLVDGNEQEEDQVLRVLRVRLIHHCSMQSDDNFRNTGEGAELLPLLYRKFGRFSIAPYDHDT